MYNITIKSSLLALSLIGGLSMGSLATAGGRGNLSPQPPMILKTALHAKENAIIITGRNFGTTPPTVTLADQALDVQRFSENEVVASLPPDLASATYSVTVTTSGRNRASSNIFSATFAHKR